MKTIHLRITGKVQGVWYRASTKDKALSLELKGRVWNEPDGAVGAYVQGTDENIASFIEWCKDGPTLAMVNEVVAQEMDMDTAYTDFQISKL